MLEHIGDALIADASVAQRHVIALQSLDEITQRNENLAAVLRSHDMMSAIESVTLGSLRARLQAAAQSG